MGDLTANLSAKEFACTCSYQECNAHKVVAHMPLVLAIQDAADHFKAQNHATAVRVTITGGNRCPKDNAATEGAATSSKHLLCIAADHRIAVQIGTAWMTIPPDDLYNYYDRKYPTSHGIGLYNHRVHLDTRPVKARWKV